MDSDELAVVERTETPIYLPVNPNRLRELLLLGGGDLGIQPQPVPEVARIDTTSTIGIWDLAPLVK